MTVKAFYLKPPNNAYVPSVIDQGKKYNLTVTMTELVSGVFAQWHEDRELFL